MKKFTEEQEKQAKSFERYIESLKKKKTDNVQLSFEEEFDLGILVERDTEILDMVEEFPYYTFNKIYQRYSEDLHFKGSYFKPNKGRQISEVVSLDELTRMNNNEFDEKQKNEIFERLISANIYVETSNDENNVAKKYLIEVAVSWGKTCLDYNGNDSDIIDAINETFEFVKKSAIKSYIENPNDEKLNAIFLTLLKIYYIFIESKRIFERIQSNNEPTEYKLHDFDIVYNFNSSMHILNRHFAQIVSSDKIKKKTFHNTKIEPYFINIFFSDLFGTLVKSNLLNNTNLDANTPINFLLYDMYYQIYFLEDSKDNKKLKINTFFMVDREDIISQLQSLVTHQLYENKFILLPQKK